MNARKTHSATCDSLHKYDFLKIRSYLQPICFLDQYYKDRTPEQCLCLKKGQGIRWSRKERECQAPETRTRLEINFSIHVFFQLGPLLLFPKRSVSLLASFVFYLRLRLNNDMILQFLFQFRLFGGRPYYRQKMGHRYSSGYFYTAKLNFLNYYNESGICARRHDRSVTAIDQCPTAGTLAQPRSRAPIKQEMNAGRSYSKKCLSRFDKIFVDQMD